MNSRAFPTMNILLLFIFHIPVTIKIPSISYSITPCERQQPFVQSIPPTAYRTPTVDLRGFVRELCIDSRRSGNRWYLSASIINSWHSTSCLKRTLFSTWSARNCNLTKYIYNYLVIDTYFTFHFTSPQNMIFYCHLSQFYPPPK